MNLLLFDDADFVSVGRAVLHDRRPKRLHEIHRVENGDTLRVGRLGGWMGEGRLLKLDVSETILEACFNQPSPVKLSITLLLALSRPKMLRRVLQIITVMGAPKLVLPNSYRMEKSLWQAPFPDPAAIRENLVLGLEQARDTVLPEIIVEERFKPFVKDRLPALIASSLGLVDHPDPWPACPRTVEKPVTLVIGPEDGWIPYEADKLREAGLHPVQLGKHILRVETTVSALPVRLF